LRKLSTPKYSSIWVQVNDSLTVEAILYPWGTFGVHGGGDRFYRIIGRRKPDYENKRQ